MAVDKRISYEIQGGVKNYLGKQKEVTAPVKWKSSPNHPETELAYITKAEKDLLIKKDLHGSLKGGVNRGPSGIMSLNGFGSEDPNQNVSGSQISAAETGSAGSGMSAQDRDDFRSAAIAAGAGQRVNPGFFDDRNTVSRAELARARAFNPRAFTATRGGGLSNFFTGGGFLGNIIRSLGQKFGLGKSFNAPYDRPQFAPGFAANTMTIGNDLDNRFALANTTNQIPVVIDNDMSLIPDRGLTVAPGDGILSIVGPNPPGFIERQDTPQSEDSFFLDAMADASKDQNREILENLFNPALNFDEALDKKEKEKKRQQELLEELMLT